MNQDAFDPDYIKIVDLDTLTETADFITLHVPLIDSTRDLFNANRIAKMKKNARLINVARGGIVNEQDLAHALNKGIIAGAAIDVFVSEEGKLDKNLILSKEKKYLILDPLDGTLSYVKKLNYF